MNGLNILKHALVESVKAFLKKDLDLLRLGVREEALSHRLACYLEQVLGESRYDLSFPVEIIESLTIDCEYDKHGSEEKRLAEILVAYPYKKSDVVRPDIVLHKRNSDINLVVVELKKASTVKKKPAERMYAKDKLKAFVNSYAYNIGLYVELNSEVLAEQSPVAYMATFLKDGHTDPNTRLTDYLNVASARKMAPSLPDDMNVEEVNKYFGDLWNIEMKEAEQDWRQYQGDWHEAQRDFN